MTVTEQPADTTPKQTTAPAPAAQGGASVRTVVTAAGLVLAAAVGVVTFVAGGWIALAAAGGVAAVGGVATVRAKSQRPRKTRPGLLTTLVGRPRKPGKSTGSLPWSLTGSQSRRASKGAGMRGGMKSGRAGTGLKLPAVTAKGRAKKAAAKAGHPLATTRPARPVAKTAKTAKAATVKKVAGPGKGRASTPTRTPAKPTTKKLITPSPKSRSPKTTTGGARPRLAAAKKPGGRPNTGRVSNAGKGATILPFKRTAKKTPARPTGTGARRPNTGATKPGMKFPRMSHGRCTPTGLRGTTGGKRLGKATGGATTKRARRLATPKARRPTTGPAGRIPTRTNRRPTTGTTKPTTRRLIGTALRVPRRNKLSLKRPTKAAQRKARRTLQLRGKLAGRRALSALWRSPGKLWRLRPSLRLWPVMPGPINPAWLPPEPSPVEVAEKRRRVMHKIRTPYPQLAGRRAAATSTNTPGGTRTMSATEAVKEAFAQLAAFEPANATEIRQLLADLPSMWEESAASLLAQADTFSSDQPVQSPVIESLHAVAAAMIGLAGMAEETTNLFETVHADDIARMTQDRGLNNEQAWDVQNNQ